MDLKLENINHLKKEIARIDKVILNIDRLLDSSQPNIGGKIRIFFWHYQGQNRPVEPVIAKRRWEVDKYPEILPLKNLTRRALSKGLFKLNYEETKFLLKLSFDLLSYRKRIASFLGEMENISQGLIRGNLYRVDEAIDSLIKVDDRILQKMTSNNLMSYYKGLDIDLEQIKISRGSDIDFDSTL